MDNFDSHDLTAVSLHAVVPHPPERRAEPRQTTLLRVGKLVVAGEDRLCMIRNISSAGAMLKLYQPVAIDDDVEVEVSPDWPVAGRVIWTQEDLAGIAFDEPVDVVAVLRGGLREGPSRRIARTPRLQVQRPARICTEEVDAETTLCDLSLNGAKVETAISLPRNVEIALFLEGMTPLAGRVRWWRDGHAGIEFDIPMPLDRLAAWLGMDREDEV